MGLDDEHIDVRQKKIFTIPHAAIPSCRNSRARGCSAAAADDCDSVVDREFGSKICPESRGMGISASDRLVDERDQAIYSSNDSKLPPRIRTHMGNQSALFYSSRISDSL